MRISSQRLKNSVQLQFCYTKMHSEMEADNWAGKKKQLPKKEHKNTLHSQLCVYHHNTYYCPKITLKYETSSG